MASITLEGNLPEQLPQREDGSSYPFCLAYENKVVLSDTRTDLVAELIAGYSELPDTEEGNDDALYMRYRSAVGVADQFQQIIAAQASNGGTFDHTVESEDVLTAIFTPRDKKITGFSPWNHVVPLVLIATDYTPFRSDPLPEGNIKFINPYTETTFLDTLSQLGVIELFVNEEEALQP